LHKTRTHIDVVGDVCKYLCHLCGKFFSSEFSLRAHVKTHEFGVGGVQMTLLGGCIGDDDRSLVDNHSYRSENSAMAPPAPQTVHIRPIHRRRTYRKPMATTTATCLTSPVKKSCPYCTLTTDDEAEFIEHVNGHIGYCNPVLPAGTVCELCEASFGDSTQLKYHLDDHVNANQALLCQACYSPFLSSAARDVHVAKECPATTMLVDYASTGAAVAPRVEFVGPSTPPEVKSISPSTLPEVKSVSPSTPPEVKSDSPSTQLPDVKFVSLPVSTPDVKFVGLSDTPQSDARPALIVDCSEIFGGCKGITDDRSSPRKSAELPIEPNADDNGSLEFSVLDELLSIMSTPRTLVALDSIDYQPPDDMSLDAIFDSISTAAD